MLGESHARFELARSINDRALWPRSLRPLTRLSLAVSPLLRVSPRDRARFLLLDGQTDPLSSPQTSQSTITSASRSRFDPRSARSAMWPSARFTHQLPLFNVQHCRPLGPSCASLSSAWHRPPTAPAHLPTSRSLGALELRPSFLNRTSRSVNFRGLSMSRDPSLLRSFYPNAAGRSSLDLDPLQGLLPTDSIPCLHDIALS